MKVSALVRVSRESDDVEGEGRKLSSLDESLPGQVTSPQPHWHSDGALTGGREISECGKDEVEGTEGWRTTADVVATAVVKDSIAAASSPCGDDDAIAKPVLEKETSGGSVTGSSKVVLYDPRVCMAIVLVTFFAVMSTPYIEPWTTYPNIAPNTVILHNIINGE